MFSRDIWLCAIAEEEIKNLSVCIYDHNTKTIRNIKDREELLYNAFVLVDQVVRFEDMKTPLTIKKGEMARCIRINISTL